MKRFILQNLFLVSFLIIAGLTYSANAACPPERDPVTGQYGGPWNQMLHKYQYVDPTTGCEATVVYTICYRENGDYHEVSFSDIKICFANCDPKKIYTQQFRDQMIINAVTHDTIMNWLGETEVPFCPGSICVLKIYDRICYSDWELNEEGCWVMRACDNELRSCAETVRVCIHPETKELTVQRFGFPSGPDCPEGCDSDCENN